MWKLKVSSIYDFFEYILAGCIILNCRSMWTSIPGVMEKFDLAVNLLLTISAVLCILLQKGMLKSKLNAYVVGGVTAVYMLLFLLFQSRNKTMFT